MRNLLLCVFLMLTTIPMWGQTNTGVITGIATDPAGAVIPGAKVTITDQSTGASLSFTTNGQGYFTTAPINPGTYTVVVTASGFQSQAQAGIVLRVQDRLNLNFKLQVGAVTQTVEVTNATPTIDTQTSSLGQVISSTTITAMPLNGRNYLELAGLSVGVVNTSASAPTDGLSGGSTGPLAVDFASDGSRGTLNNYILDGIDNNSNDNGGIVIQTQPDALQEFKIQTSSYSAEFGRSGGAVINAVTKSGTNSYHGDAYEFLRNSVLNTRDFFQTTGPKAPFKQNQWGGTIGGFIIKDKLFWFGDYEGTSIRNYRTRFATVPSAAEISGDFTGDPTIYDPTTNTTDAQGNVHRESFAAEYGNGNKIPASVMDPISSAFAQLYPAANIPGQTKNNYSRLIHEPYDLMQGDFRGDWDPSQKDQSFFRYSDVGFTSEQDQIFPGIAQGQSGSGTFESQMGASLGETHIFSPTVINEFRLGFSWYGDSQEIPPFGIHFPPPNLTIPGIPLNAKTAGLAQWSPNGYRGLGMSGYDPTYLATEEREVSDAISIEHGKHSMVTGFEMRWSEFNIFQVPNPDGYLNFDGSFTTDPATGDGGDPLADGLLGLTIVAIYDTQVEVQNRQHVPSAFFQDDWRVSPTLTLNLGLRYDYFSPIVGKHNVQGNFNYATGQLVIAGGQCPSGATYCVNGNSRGLVSVDHDNFAPRIGFAKTIHKNTVVSAGGGIFWSGQEIKTAGPLQLAYNLPFYYEPNFTSDGITPIIKVSTGFPPPNPNQALNPGVTSLGGTPTNTGNNPYLATPSYIQYNLSVQQALPGRTSLQVAGAASKGTHLQSVLDYNQDQTPGSGDVQSRRPHPIYGSFTSMVDRGNSEYYALQVRFEKQSSQNLYFLNSFTWGKAYDDQAEICCAGPPPNSWNVPSEKGLADFNETLREVFSWDYLLPIGSGQKFASGVKPVVNQVIGGWHFGGIYSLGSGFPFSPVLGYDSSNTGTLGTVRPDQVLPDGNLPRGQRTINNWFNTAAYADPAVEFAGTPGIYRFGDAGRNTLIGPDVNDLDVSLRKTFPIHESQNIEFRGEFFNALNHPSFSQPDPTLTDGAGAFGVVTSTAGPNREVQVALKYNF
jgi:hypothetical protein